MKKIMIIDDSALMRRALSDIMKHTNEYKVAYTANNGDNAYEIITMHKDISAILCDIDMPGLDGISLLKAIRRDGIRTPLIFITSRQDSNTAIEALKAGASEFLRKPERLFRDDDPEFRDLLLTALAKHALPAIADALSPNPAEHAYASRVARTLEQRETEPDAASGKKAVRGNTEILKSKVASKPGSKVLVALVCSTGGPKALQFVIPKLPANLNAPVVMVQHMPKGFTASLAQRLDTMSEVKVQEAVEGKVIEKGNVYIAKGGMHMVLNQNGRDVSLAFDDSPPIVGLKPCGNLMYESIVHLDCYDEIVCVVLTGMGSDGTKGIQALKNAGRKIYVIAQDEASSTVYGMPKAIFDSGLTDVVCDIHEVADHITKKVGVL